MRQITASFLFGFLTLAGLVNGTAAYAQSGDLIIEVTNIRNAQGRIGILLFNKPEGFPGQEEAALHAVMLPIEMENGTVRHVFSAVPYGRYAVTVMHDENGNSKLDANIFGIPREGYGISNKAKGFMGPPKFGDAAFSFAEPESIISIEMGY